MLNENAGNSGMLEAVINAEIILKESIDELTGAVNKFKESYPDLKFNNKFIGLD